MLNCYIISHYYSFFCTCLTNRLQEDGSIYLAKRFNGISQFFAGSTMRNSNEPQQTGCAWGIPGFRLHIMLKQKRISIRLHFILTDTLIFFQKCFLKTLQQIRQYNELKAKETKEEVHFQLHVTAV